MQPADRNVVEAETPRQRFSKEIRAAWQKSVEGILEASTALLKANDELWGADFAEMIEKDLPFTERTAQRLIAIARNPVISDATHVSVFPASWATLYQLTRVRSDVLEARIADGTIHSKMTREDAIKLIPPSKPRPTPRSKGNFTELLKKVVAELKRNNRDKQSSFIRQLCNQLGIDLTDAAFQNTEGRLGPGDL